ncbi:MAG: hypothetical protein CVT92_14630 [Bacteroidetes bacterium HGW-Bacteroidetes-1]|nr:MAG: hypothetical protein CVT92_14630 [Bacteroidetes bacterium HGW-Bacteroidetes-1]
MLSFVLSESKRIGFIINDGGICILKILFMRIVYLSIFFFAVLFSISVTAERIQFKHITINDGLSQNAVFAILKDSKGFMWFGTKDGLNRYDGNNFVVYQHNPFDSTSISANYITELFEDSRGLIWVGTLDGGLNVFNRKLEIFYRIYLQPNDSTVNNIYDIKTITEDPDGNIWVGTRVDGLFRITVIENPFFQCSSKHYIAVPGVKNGLSHNMVNSLHWDSNGKLYIGTAKGLDIYSNKTGKFSFQFIPTRNINFFGIDTLQGITSVFQSKSGTLWLGSLSGLVRYDKENGDFQLYPHRYEIARYGWGSINKIMEDHAGKLWLATPGGLMRFDPVKLTYEYFNNNPLDPHSISYNSISSLLFDQNQLLWIGTTGMGIDIYDQKQNRFATFDFKKNPFSRTSGFSVRSILEDNDGRIWVSSDVLYIWDRKNDSILSFEKSSDSINAFGNTGITSMIKTPEGDIWAGTSEGLFHYTFSTKSVRHYKPDTGKSNSLPHKQVYAVLSDREGSIWAATSDYVCKLIDRKEGNFQTMKYSSDLQLGKYVHNVLFQDHNGAIWLGTQDGLCRINTKDETFTKFKNDPEKQGSLSSNLIKSISADPLSPEKYLWIGTAGGLNRFDLSTETFEYFNETDGLPNNVIYGILPDEMNNLWISTNKGLSRFNTQTHTFRNFDVADGLQSNEFNTGAFYRSSKGEMFFGGIKGLNYFSPAEIKDNQHRPPIVLTSLRIGNRIVSHKTDPELFQASISEIDQMILKHNDDVITFEFSALDFSAPKKNQYAYMLENYNDSWIYSGFVNRVTFTNLPPGEYVFRVKGSNNDGVWNEEGLSVSLVIKPPWWQTPWAYMIYILLIINALYLIRRYELTRVRLRNQLRLEKVETDLLRNLDQMKSQFFANISHEFRTPLTLILGQIESVMSSAVDNKEKVKLQVAKRNGRRLLMLINQLLDLSKLEAGSMELTASQHNIVSFLKSLFYSFEFIAASKHIHQHFHSDLNNIQVIFDQDKLEKVFYNLVSNAIKFTEENGTIEVKVKVVDAGFVEISIEDNGPGIPVHQLPYIFDRFYQADSSATRKYEGTGIGLALAKELVELHQGAIIVKSTEGKGTEFIVRLPLSKADNTDDKKDEKGLRQDYIHVFDDDLNDSEGIGLSATEASDVDREIVLIVEDNRDIRSFIHEQLQEVYQILEASNGEEGIVKAREYVPDLIITDVMMPRMNGYEMCVEIRKDERISHIPLIMLTAKAALEDKLEGLDKGIDDFITKPFSAKELQVRARNLISLRKALRQRFSRSTIIKPSEVSTRSIDQVFLEKVLSIIESHFEDSSFTNELLAAEMNMSVSQLNRKINALIGQPAGQLMRSLKLQRAADLLKNRSGTVAEICYQLCFNDQAYFSRAFKKQFGSSPLEFMKE